MAVDQENRIQDWIKAFDTLPPDRQESLKQWFAVQKIVIDNAGLTAEEWFAQIAWAMDNPFDYSFILDFPENPVDSPTADKAEASETIRDAKKLVGGTTKQTAVADGPGMGDKAQKEGLDKELFNRFMKDHLKP